MSKLFSEYFFCVLDTSSAQKKYICSGPQYSDNPNLLGPYTAEILRDKGLLVETRSIYPFFLKKIDISYKIGSSVEINNS